MIWHPVTRVGPTHVAGDTACPPRPSGSTPTERGRARPSMPVDACRPGRPTSMDGGAGGAALRAGHRVGQPVRTWSGQAAARRRPGQQLLVASRQAGGGFSTWQERWRSGRRPSIVASCQGARSAILWAPTQEPNGSSAVAAMPNPRGTAVRPADARGNQGTRAATSACDQRDPGGEGPQWLAMPSSVRACARLPPARRSIATPHRGDTASARSWSFGSPAPGPPWLDRVGAALPLEPGVGHVQLSF